MQYSVFFVFHNCKVQYIHTFWGHTIHHINAKYECTIKVHTTSFSHKRRRGVAEGPLQLDRNPFNWGTFPERAVAHYLTALNISLIFQVESSRPFLLNLKLSYTHVVHYLCISILSEEVCFGSKGIPSPYLMKWSQSLERARGYHIL